MPRDYEDTADGRNGRFSPGTYKRIKQNRSDDAGAS